LTFHRLFVAGQAPGCPGRPQVCYGLAERSLKARHEPAGRLRAAGAAPVAQRRGPGHAITRRSWKPCSRPRARR